MLMVEQLECRDVPSGFDSGFDPDVAMVAARAAGKIAIEQHFQMRTMANQIMQQQAEMRINLAPVQFVSSDLATVLLDIESHKNK